MGDRGFSCSGGRVQPLNRANSLKKLNYISTAPILQCPQPLRVKIPHALTSSKKQNKAHCGIGEAEACQEIERILLTKSPNFSVISSGAGEGGSVSRSPIPPFASSCVSTPEYLEDRTYIINDDVSSIPLCHSPNLRSHRIESKHSVPTPPLRCSNPITINPNFTIEKAPPEGAEIGLLSVSPPPFLPATMRDKIVEKKTDVSLTLSIKGRRLGATKQLS
eukprot:TRINITY_DN15717_c0_g1_i1.p1 TRINITY_DN15717_c0_g1~~TRINITY_DN15717_c0_g1_i1.p1  ORF type:complete len:244 (-),score=30.50 TRINITY_DN15717_c0_g1_i1:104-763(-)